MKKIAILFLSIILVGCTTATIFGLLISLGVNDFICSKVVDISGDDTGDGLVDKDMDGNGEIDENDQALYSQNLNKFSICKGIIEFILTTASGTIEVRDANTGQWVVLTKTPEEFNLLELQGKERSMIYREIPDIPIGSYDQLRIDLDNVQVVTKDKTYTAVMPSKEIIIDIDMVVEKNRKSAVVLNLDLAKSIYITGNNDFIFAPVFKIESRSNLDSIDIYDQNRKLIKTKGGMFVESKTVGMDLDGKMKKDFVIDKEKRLTVIDNKISFEKESTSQDEIEIKYIQGEVSQKQETIQVQEKSQDKIVLEDKTSKEILSISKYEQQDFELLESSNDPKITMIVVNDKTCKTCTTEAVQKVNEKAFKTVTEKVIDISTKQGEELIEKYGIKMIPFYIYDSKIKEAVNFEKIQNALVKKDDSYYINPAAGVSVKILQLPNVNQEHVKGKTDAPITMIGWLDFQCPFCRRFYTDSYNELNKQYIETGDVKLVFKHFPLNFHEHAQKAAEAAECAGEQGKFWEMYDKLFENQDALTVNYLTMYAKELDLNINQFNSCLSSGRMAEKITKDMQEGMANGVTGTPSFIINGIMVSGAQPFEAFENVIKQFIVNEDGSGYSPKEIDLKGFPNNFLVDGKFNGYIVYGTNAPVEDELVANYVKAIFDDVSTTSVSINQLKTDNKITSISGKNIILIGNACTNSVISAVMGNPENCKNVFGIESGQALVRLISMDNNNVLLIIGVTPQDIKQAGEILKNWQTNQMLLTGKEVVLNFAEEVVAE